jgi:hypothetical protein
MAKRPEATGLDAVQRALAKADVEAARAAVTALSEDDRALLRAEIGDEAVRQLYQVVRRRRSGRKHGRVVLLNGIMGAMLDAVDLRDGDADRVWVNLWRLAGGRIRDLELNTSGQPTRSGLEVRVAGLHKSYLRLLFELERRWHVMPFAYDWRHDIDRTAERLAGVIRSWSGGEPVHLVAHSMGGLVSRRFVQKFPDVWRDCDDPAGRKRGGRLVQLGTPNRGSYAIPLTLTAGEKLVRMLAAIDLKHSQKSLLKILGSFPGCYQMLPSPLSSPDDDHRRLFTPSSWGGHPVQSRLLALGRRFQEELAPVIDADRIVYVAGYDQKTTHRIRIEKPGSFTYQETQDGDGRVPHELGLLDGVSTFWVRESHGALPGNDAVLEGIHDLLLTGSTSALEDERPVRRAVRAAERWIDADEIGALPEGFEAAVKSLAPARGRARARTAPPPTAESIEVEASMLDAYVGGAATRGRAGGRRRGRGARGGNGPAGTLAVEVTWGDITQATGDIFCVGHYQGVLPQAAEWALDQVVSGTTGDVPEEALVLTQLTRRGVLRGGLGEVSFFPWADRRRHRTVAVVGMGRPGTFTDGKLRHVARSLAWAVGSLPKPGTICTVLIGSGNGCLDLRTAIRMTIDGLADAIQGGLTSPIERIRFVERDLQKAYELRDELKRIAKRERRLTLELKSTVTRGRGGAVSEEAGLAYALAAAATADDRRAVKKILEEIPTSGSRRKHAAASLESLARRGGRRSLDPLAARIRISLAADDAPAAQRPTRISYRLDDDGLRVAAIDDRAVVPQRTLGKDPSLIDEMTTLTTDPAPEDTRELADQMNYLLVPPDFRELLRWQTPLVVEVDRDMASVHWEFLSRDPTDENDADPFLALKAPLARQLATAYSSPPLSRGGAPTRRALVVGDPGDPAEDDNLPGARLEAQRVVEVLERKGYEVVARIGAPRRSGRGPISGIPPATRLDVIHLLCTGGFDVLHYAGHCDFDPDAPDTVGWIFKGGLLTPAELEGMDRAPRVIVANACLSARTSAVLASGETVGAARRESDLLPTLADEFFRRGVQNYVGTAWEVNDEGAVLFTETLYDAFLPGPDTPGRTLGESVRLARQTLFAEEDVFGSLWAAYQHYGDPTFRVDA